MLRLYKLVVGGEYTADFLIYRCRRGSEVGRAMRQHADIFSIIEDMIQDKGIL